MRRKWENEVMKRNHLDLKTSYWIVTLTLYKRTVVQET